MKYLILILIILSLLITSCGLSEEKIKKRDWYLNYGAYYYEGKRFDQAEEMVLKAKEIEPDNLKADLMLAFIYHFKGDYKHAETKFTEILDNNPANAKVHHGMAINYFQQGNQRRKVGIEFEGEEKTKFTQSLKHFEKASNNVDSVDWNPIFNYQISLVYTQVGLDHFGYKNRLLALQKNLRNKTLQKDFPPEKQDEPLKLREERLLQQVLLTAEEEGKNLEDAFEILMERHTLKGNTNFLLAIRYLETHDKFLVTQLESLEKEVKTVDKNTKFSFEQKHDGRQLILDRKARVTEARTSAITAIGLLHFRMKEYDKSLQVLQEIPKFDPNNPIVHLNTGLTLIRKAQEREEGIQGLLKQVENQKQSQENLPPAFKTEQDLIESLYQKAIDELSLYLVKERVGQPQLILMVKNVLSNLENRNTIQKK